MSCKGLGDIADVVNFGILQGTCSAINGEHVGRGSNKFGWLQTFLNCIRTFITDSKLPLSSVSFVLALDIKSSYK